MKIKIFTVGGKTYEAMPAIHQLHFGSCNVVTVNQGRGKGHLVMTSDERVTSDHPHEGKWRLIVGLPDIFAAAAKALG